MKTKEELNAMKEEVETLNKKLAELNEDELEQVTGGGWSGFNGQQNMIPPSAESLIAPAPCNEGEQDWKPSTMRPVFGGHGTDLTSNRQYNKPWNPRYLLHHMWYFPLIGNPDNIAVLSAY